MANTRKPGITVDANGNRIINKEHHGIRLFVRLGNISQNCVSARRAHVHLLRWMV